MRFGWRGRLVGLGLAAMAMLVVGGTGAVAATFVVNCPPVGADSLQAAINAACSDDVIEVSGTCNEAVTVGMQVAVCPQPGPFDNLQIKGRSKKGSGASVVEGVGGPGITVTANAIKVTIKDLMVGSDTSHGIAVLSAHKVSIDNVTTPSPGGTVDDGIHVDTLSTNTEITDSTLNQNPGDGLELGATYGQVNNVTANDNGLAGFRITGGNADVQRSTADNTTAGNAQMFGFLVDGRASILQRCLARTNTIAQFYDTPNSHGVIHFRNEAGDDNATVVPASGKGFWEEGTGNYISSSTAVRNAEEGVHLAGDGNNFQVSTSTQNVGSQILITGSRNFLDRNSAVRVSAPNTFESTDPAIHVMAGSTANFFHRNSVSVSGTVKGDGYTIVDANNPDPTTTGIRNSRRPGVDGDPPEALR